jgi:cation diffusion facilitator CzcD-associated flavoprotein CzcO
VEVAEHFDVIVVGAGLAGVGAACQLNHTCPDKSLAILEARDAIGGTWDLFRYPGIRSDSDMFTLGYRWKPWLGRNAIADGSSILAYVRETARESGIDQKIRFGRRVKRASFTSERALWSVEVESGPERELERYTCSFLYVCAGYYAYEAGYTPEFEGVAEFSGRIVHPQLWTDDIDYAAKRVVVIGSGATAVTLVPELAKQAAHVVMLQRSPTYFVSAPAHDFLADGLRRWFSARFAYFLTRWKNILAQLLFFKFVRAFPAFAKRALVGRVAFELGPGHDIERDFTPRYGVWDQRLCLVPNGDLLQALRSGAASIVTDQIERFTPSGIRLRSGQELPAELVVTATGLELRFAGGVELSVDGRTVEPGTALSYRGCMLCDIPNFAYVFGYTNASWTLKADLVAEFVCRVLRHMDDAGAKQCAPRRTDPTLEELPFLDFTSGYIQRGLPRFPKQGSKRPFHLYQNYALDLWTLRYGALDDGTLQFSSAPSPAEHSVPELANVGE